MKRLRDFTGGPVVKTTFSTAWGMDSISGGGTKIPTYLVVHGTTKKKKKRIRRRKKEKTLNRDFYVPKL